MLGILYLLRRPKYHQFWTTQKGADQYVFQRFTFSDKIRRFIPPKILEYLSSRRWTIVDEDDLKAVSVARNMKEVAAAGGTITVGSHGEFQGLGLHFDMRLLSKGGFSNLEVLEAATINGARKLGLAERIGSLERGKLADLVVLGADPLVDLQATSDVRFVMKDGILYDADTLKVVQIAGSVRER